MWVRSKVYLQKTARVTRIGNYSFEFCISLASHTWKSLSEKLPLRLLFVLATEHTLLRMFLNIWRQILYPEDLRDADL